MTEYPDKVRLVKNKITKPRIQISYPRVVGMESKLIQWRINRQIRSKVEDLLKGQGYLGNLREMRGTYRTMLNGRGFLSIRLDNYAYLEGAAHGLTNVGSLNLDLKTGYNYALEDLFLPGSPYIEALNNLIDEEIEEEGIPLTRAFPGVSPRHDYYLTAKELVVYFQLYEFTPYAYGVPEFRIPFSRLQKWLDPELSII